ncbi:MAG: aminoacyl-tRNA hydrolase [Candidatus Kerfeldbacteria bacterium]|nr:aminoacyl-tRNA hydrolase [Candidatus Kerfeldbacteria bacterium]
MHNLWLIVGLGNPEKKYDRTRHNVGFRILDALASDFREEKKFNALVTKRDNIIYCKPLTYMNDSGDAVQPLAHFYDIPVERIVVIYDDKEIPFGTLRLRSSGSDAGHNGIKSIIERLGSKEFPRIKIGVGMMPEQWDAADYVLAPFTADEEKVLPEILQAAEEAIRDIVVRGLNPQTHRDITVQSEK